MCELGSVKPGSSPIYDNNASPALDLNDATRQSIRPAADTALHLPPLNVPPLGALTSLRHTQGRCSIMLSERS